MTEYVTNGEASRRAARERTTRRVGDGTQVTAEQFAKFGYSERTELARVNRDAYRALADGEAGR